MTDAMIANCHCGAVALRVTLADGLATATRCDCSFCRRRGAPAVTVPRDELTILRGEHNLTLYSFGTHTAQHYFCKTCGIYLFHRRRSNPDEYGVNAYALDGVLPQDIEPLPWVDGINHPSDTP